MEKVFGWFFFIFFGSQILTMDLVAGGSILKNMWFPWPFLPLQILGTAILIPFTIMYLMEAPVSFGLFIPRPTPRKPQIVYSIPECEYVMIDGETPSYGLGAPPTNSLTDKKPQTARAVLQADVPGELKEEVPAVSPILLGNIVEVQTTEPKTGTGVIAQRKTWVNSQRYPCHYCLEPLPLLAIDPKKESRECPICRHKVLENYLREPVHGFSRLQKWALILGELDHIWRWEYSLLRSYKYLTDGRGHYDEARGDFDKLEQSIDFLRASTREIMEMNEDLEMDVLARLSIHAGWDSDLQMTLLYSAPFREMASSLSLQGLPSLDVAKFQKFYVEKISWGAFDNHYTDGKNKNEVLKLLNDRLVEF